MVNAWKVLNAETELSVAKWSLNDTKHLGRCQQVDITNSGTKPVTYSFSLQEPDGFLALREATASTPHPIFINGPGASDINHPDGELFTPVKAKPDVTLPENITLAPGETKTVQVNFVYPTMDAKQMPAFSGKVLVHGSNGDELSIAYLGVLPIWGRS